jgi:hypothetical protein
VVTKKTVVNKEAFQPEQIDIQQQMKDLLKKQKTVRTVEPDDEEIDELEEAETFEEERDL